MRQFDNLAKSYYTNGTRDSGPIDPGKQQALLRQLVNVDIWAKVAHRILPNSTLEECVTMIKKLYEEEHPKVHRIIAVLSPWQEDR